MMFYPITLTPLTFKLLTNLCGRLLGIVLFLTACFTTIAAQTSAYVVRQANDNEVVVIDTSTNLILATIPTGGDGSFRVDANPNGDWVYVANVGSQDISVIDTATNTVITKIPVGVFASDVAFTPDGSRAYVTGFSLNSVVVIDATTHTVIDTIPIQLSVSVAVSPGGEFAYVTTLGPNLAGTLAVIDTSTNTVVETLALGGEPQAIAFSPTEDIAYVTELRGVFVIDTTSHTVITTIAVGEFPAGLVVTPDGSLVYVTNGLDNSVSVIDTSDNSVIATIPVGLFPLSIDITPDGRFVYVSNINAGTVSVIDTRSNTVVTTITVGGILGGIAIAPLNSPTSIEQCKQGGYLSFSNPVFKNQGQCVKFVNDRIRHR
jgi:YVTN family beta-propeller protein